MEVKKTSVDFGKVGAGMSSENEVITVVNTGSKAAKVSAMMLNASDGFYIKSLRLNSLNIFKLMTGFQFFHKFSIAGLSNYQRKQRLRYALSLLRFFSRSFNIITQ